MNKTMKQYKGKVLKAMDDALRHELRTGWHIYLVFLLF